MVHISKDKKHAASDISAGTSAALKEKEFTVVHLSDLHLACMDEISLHQLLNKRILGYLRWKLGRSREFDYRILATLERELQQIRADHVIITGDLTHLGLPAEFRRVSAWLKALGPPGTVTIVPGNHDAYTAASWSDTFSIWKDYLLPCSPYRGQLPPPAAEEIFPTLCTKGSTAVIGVSTARPCAWHLATGRAGRRQLQRLEAILKDTGASGLFRILAVHHPPVPGVVNRRKGLTDARAMLRIIRRCGCELILHGHSHRTSIYSIKTASLEIPVVEAPSALSVSRIKRRRARYFIYKISCREGHRWQCSMEERLLASPSAGFATGETRDLLTGRAPQEGSCGVSQPDKGGG